MAHEWLRAGRGASWHLAALQIFTRDHLFGCSSHLAYHFHGLLAVLVQLLVVGAGLWHVARPATRNIESQVTPDGWTPFVTAFGLPPVVSDPPVFTVAKQMLDDTAGRKRWRPAAQTRLSDQEPLPSSF